MEYGRYGVQLYAVVAKDEVVKLNASFTYCKLKYLRTATVVVVALEHTRHQTICLRATVGQS